MRLFRRSLRGLKPVRFRPAHKHPGGLNLLSPAPSNSVVISARRSLRIEGKQRVIVIALLPVHHYCSRTRSPRLYATMFLVESSFAQQTGVAQAFDRSVRKSAAGTKDAIRRAGWQPLPETTDCRQAAAQYRNAEEPGNEQPIDRASAGRQRERHPQAGRAFPVRRVGP